MATASELFEARHYPGVIALVTDALDGEPDCVPLLLLRARAHMGLRRDLEAQADLRDIIRLDPQCSLAYRLLGELAARRNENESAAIFFSEALRLDPADIEADTWLAVVQCTAARAPSPRLAKGTYQPNDEERPTARFSAQRTSVQTDLDIEALPPPPDVRLAKGSSPHLDSYRPHPGHRAVTAAGIAQPRHAGVFKTYPAESHTHDSPAIARGSEPSVPNLTSASESSGQAQAVRRPLSQPSPSPSPSPLSSPATPRRGAVPELPGFGDYLVATGILTRERLRAAQAYQRSMKVQLATAIVTLGLATPQRIEWAAVAHQSQLGRGG